MNMITFSPSCCPPTATKQKPKNKKQMKTKKPTIKAKNRWRLVSNEMLTFNEVVIPTSVTADSNVSQVSMPVPKNMAMVRDQQRMRDKGLVPHLKRPDVVAKRLAAVQKYWHKRRTATEATKRYNERYGLKCISARIPMKIVDAFSALCKEHNLCQAEVIARMLRGFIQRNSYPNTK